MVKVRKYNYYYSDFGFISNGNIVVYKFNKNISVADVFKVKIEKNKSVNLFNLDLLVIFLFSDLVINFYCICAIVLLHFLINKTKKPSYCLTFEMDNGAVLELPIKDKLYRKAKVFRNRILEYKLFLEINK